MKEQKKWRLKLTPEEQLDLYLNDIEDKAFRCLKRVHSDYHSGHIGPIVYKAKLEAINEMSRGFVKDEVGYGIDDELNSLPLSQEKVIRVLRSKKSGQVRVYSLVIGDLVIRELTQKKAFRPQINDQVKTSLGVKKALDRLVEYAIESGEWTEL